MVALSNLRDAEMSSEQTQRVKNNSILQKVQDQHAYHYPIVTADQDTDLQPRNDFSRQSTHGPERMGDPEHFGTEGRAQNDFSLDQEERHLRNTQQSSEPSASVPETEKDFTVTWDGEDDPGNPRSMTKARKWMIVVVIALSSFCVTVNSSLYTFTYAQLEPEFHISREVATLGLSLFVIGLACGPLFLAPLSEFYGRRPIYLGAFTMFFIWIIPCAVAQNIQTLLIARFFVGVAGSAFLSVAGGTVGDCFNKAELSFPMMVYSGSPFLGPATAPVFGGALNQYVNWRWSFWVLLIWTGIQAVAIFFIIPETYHPVLLRRKARKLRKETGNELWQAPIEKLSRSILWTVLWSIMRPFQLLFLEPMCLLLCILSAILLGTLYLFFGAFPLVFGTNHGFDLLQNGLTFLGLFVGMVLGILSDPIWRRIYRHLVSQREKATGEVGVSEPEFRLPPTIFGAILVPLGLFGFGWTTYSFVPWIVPIVFSGFIGMGIIQCYAGIFTYLVEAYPLYAASALAANSFLRSVFAAAFPLFGNQMFTKLGYQWASSLLAFLALAMAPFPYIFFKYGKQIRGASKYAS